MINKNYTDIAHFVKEAQRIKSKKILKILLGLTLLIITFEIFFILFYFPRNKSPSNFLNQNSNKNLSPQNSQISRVTLLVFPMRLIIPEINIDANIQRLGVTSNGDMEVPNNSVDAGWFDLGPQPGEKGSAIIAGHVDTKDDAIGVFANLYKLKKGNKLYIENSKGMLTTFVVRESRTYDPGRANDVFISSDSAHLNLITCDGSWDAIKGSYNKRLVIFADYENLQ